MTSLQRRLQKLELRSLAYGLAARPDGESKRFVIARIEAIRQRLQAARDRGDYVPTAVQKPIDPGHFAAGLLLDDTKRTLCVVVRAGLVQEMESHDGAASNNCWNWWALPVG